MAGVPLVVGAATFLSAYLYSGHDQGPSPDRSGPLAAVGEYLTPNLTPEQQLNLAISSLAVLGAAGQLPSVATVITEGILEPILHPIASAVTNLGGGSGLQALAKRAVLFSASNRFGRAVTDYAFGKSYSGSVRDVVSRPRVLGSSMKFTRGAHQTFSAVGDAMPRRSVKSRSSTVSQRAKRSMKKKSSTKRSAKRSNGGSSAPLARIEQGYMRNEGWIKMRSQKYWDTNLFPHVYTDKLPNFMVPLNRFVDMLAIPSLTYSATTVLQSARTKSNIMVSRVCADFSCIVPNYSITAGELGIFYPTTTSHVLIQLLLDTQANGTWSQATGQSGSPFVSSSIDSGGGVFGSGLIYPPNLQNVGRWYVVAEQLVVIENTMTYGGSNIQTICGGQKHVCFDVPFDNGLLIEYDTDINDGGIATRRTNNLVFCVTSPDWNATEMLPPTVTCNWTRTYFQDL